MLRKETPHHGAPKEAEAKGKESVHPSQQALGTNVRLVTKLSAGVALLAIGYAALSSKAESSSGSAQLAFEENVVSSAVPLQTLPQELMPTSQDLEWRVISQDPRIYAMDNFLSVEECKFLKDLGAARLEPARVVRETENKYDMQEEVRNNQQMWLTAEEERETPLLRHILKRMHRAARIPDEDAEALQIGRYGPGEKYELHLDTDPEHDVARPATLIVYLHEAEEGGETVFPLGGTRDSCLGWHTLSNGSQLYGAAKCCIEENPSIVKIPTRTGRAVLFWNHDLNGVKQSMSEHAACPVRQGEKWIAQRWFRFSPYQSIRHPPDWRFDGLPSLVHSTERLADTSAATAPGWLEVRALSQKAPRLYLVEDLLTVEECRHLIEAALQLEGFQENGLARRWLPPDLETKDSTIASLVKRLHRVALVPEANGERLQVGFAESGSAVQLHVDSSPDHHLVRPLTMIIYLDGDGMSGAAGATVFPLGRCRNPQDCCEMAAQQDLDSGPLAIPPKAGRALLFASHSLDGQLDHHAAHMSCPAGPQGKWVAQRWFQGRPQNQFDYGRDPLYDGLGALDLQPH